MFQADRLDVVLVVGQHPLDGLVVAEPAAKDLARAVGVLQQPVVGCVRPCPSACPPRRKRKRLNWCWAISKPAPFLTKQIALQAPRTSSSFASLVRMPQVRDNTGMSRTLLEPGRVVVDQDDADAAVALGSVRHRRNRRVGRAVVSGAPHLAPVDHPAGRPCGRPSYGCAARSEPASGSVKHIDQPLVLPSSTGYRYLLFESPRMPCTSPAKARRRYAGHAGLGARDRISASTMTSSIGRPQPLTAVIPSGMISLVRPYSSCWALEVGCSAPGCTRPRLTGQLLVVRQHLGVDKGCARGCCRSCWAGVSSKSMVRGPCGGCSVTLKRPSCSGSRPIRCSQAAVLSVPLGAAWAAR